MQNTKKDVCRLVHPVLPQISLYIAHSFAILTMSQSNAEYGYVIDHSANRRRPAQRMEWAARSQASYIALKKSTGRRSGRSWTAVRPPTYAMRPVSSRCARALAASRGLTDGHCSIKTSSNQPRMASMRSSSKSSMTLDMMSVCSAATVLVVEEAAWGHRSEGPFGFSAEGVCPPARSSSPLS